MSNPFTTPQQDPHPPIKLQCPRTGRYVGGQLREMRGSEALISLHRAAAFAPGDRVRLAMAHAASQAVIAAGDLVEATVLGQVQLEGERRLAVRIELAPLSAAV